MSILQRHEHGCTPLDPCKWCRIANYLRSRLTPEEMVELSKLLGATEQSKALDIRIVALPLSVRTKHCLENDRINLVREVVEKTDAELLRIPNFGRRSLNEVKETLAEHGLHLGMKL